jgi:hypothetical protein
MRTLLIVASALIHGSALAMDPPRDMLASCRGVDPSEQERSEVRLQTTLINPILIQVRFGYEMYADRNTLIEELESWPADGSNMERAARAFLSGLRAVPDSEYAIDMASLPIDRDVLIDPGDRMNALERRRRIRALLLAQEELVANVVSQGRVVVQRADGEALETHIGVAYFEDRGRAYAEDGVQSGVLVSDVNGEVFFVNCVWPRVSPDPVAPQIGSGR